MSARVPLVDDYDSIAAGLRARQLRRMLLRMCTCGDKPSLVCPAHGDEARAALASVGGAVCTCPPGGVDLDCPAHGFGAAPWDDST